MYISENCNWTPYGTDPELDKKVDSENYSVRIYIVSQGYGLDKLINDEEWRIRRYVAEKGYGLDILVNDESYEVRCEVAKQGYGLDKLINDKSTYVRQAIAYQGYGLDKLVNDKDYNVRSIVARQGYGLDKLITDEFWDVSKFVPDYLNKHNQTLLSWWNENADKRYYESFHDIINENILVNSEGELVEQLLKDNMYLDWILNNNISYKSYRLEIRQVLIDLGCNDIQEWKENYPSNVYYR